MNKLSRNDLVEKNYHLIEKTMAEYNLKETDIPDWYGALAVALCKAADIYINGFSRYSVDELYRVLSIVECYNESPENITYPVVLCMYENLTDDLKGLFADYVINNCHDPSLLRIINKFIF